MMPNWVRSPPGRRSRVCTSVSATQRTMPEATDAYDTSMTKRKTGGCGGRTMYSAAATNSTEPR